jgi:ubiquinone/menaquinone biosynthesis C-methylase UbiE
MRQENRQHLEREVASHYGRPGLAEAISEGLTRSGADPNAPTIEALAPVDEFHTAGRITTLKALGMMPLQAGMHILDAGSGIGGTARCLAGEYACRVTGLDLTPDYIEIARTLTRQMGLADSCDFRQGSVLDMPFEDAAFDGAITFHVAMNNEDRSRFYDELSRVLRRGAPVCVFDVMKGPAEGMLFPVPWAETEATSFLRSRDETVRLLDEAGFRLNAEENLRGFAIGYFRDVFAGMAEAGGPPPLGLHLLTGANAPEKFQNYLKSVEAHQIEPVILIGERM